MANRIALNRISTLLCPPSRVSINTTLIPITFHHLLDPPLDQLEAPPRTTRPITLLPLSLFHLRSSMVILLQDPSHSCLDPGGQMRMFKYPISNEDPPCEEAKTMRCESVSSVKVSCF